MSTSSRSAAPGGHELAGDSVVADAQERGDRHQAVVGGVKGAGPQSGTAVGPAVDAHLDLGRRSAHRGQIGLREHARQ
jgi:hypothetical protein